MGKLNTPAPLEHRGNFLSTPPKCLFGLPRQKQCPQGALFAGSPHGLHGPYPKPQGITFWRALPRAVPPCCPLGCKHRDRGLGCNVKGIFLAISTSQLAKFRGKCTLGWFARPAGPRQGPLVCQSVLWGPMHLYTTDGHHCPSISLWKWAKCGKFLFLKSFASDPPPPP